MHVQSCCFANLNYCFFTVLVAVARSFHGALFSFFQGHHVKRFGWSDIKALRFYDVIFTYMTPSIYFTQNRTLSLCS